MVRSPLAGVSNREGVIIRTPRPSRRRFAPPQDEGHCATRKMDDHVGRAAFSQ